MTSYWQSDPPGELRIPVARPRLPSTEQLLPYLRRIDQAQWYSNSGPLVLELEDRLALHCGEGTAHVATVANATLGLALALLAHDLPAGALCLVPSWTFAATGHAVLLAGLKPWIVDVSPETWTLEPAAARAILETAPGPVAAVIPVSPYGAPLALEGWRKFRADTGIAVVLDAAAAFDSVCASELPAVVSLHATKVCGIGEGGFVVATDASLIEEVQKRANFGFWYSREATAHSLNGKISEYAAAVGHAALDCWPETRRDFARVAGAYREGLKNDGSIGLQAGLGDSWVTSTIVIAVPDGRAGAIEQALTEARIGTRRWWGGGLRRHRAFAGFPHTTTAESDLLAERTLGLPCYRDLPNEDISRICEIVQAERSAS